MMEETYPSTVEGREERSPAEWEQRAMDVVQENAAAGLIDVYLGPDMPVFLIRAHAIRSVAGALHAITPEEGFAVLLDITAVDYSAHPAETPARFAVVWHFVDMRNGRHVRVKAYVADGASVPSLADVYGSAAWAEREVWDLMGIPFTGHPSLTRIFMPEDYEGHPLRKEFPTQGPDRGKRIHGEVLGNKPLTSWKELHEI